MDINKMTKEQIEYRIRQIDGREMFLISADYMTDEQREEVRAITLEREQLQKRLGEELGKLTARMSGKRKPVIKIDEAGRIVETYVSVREAGIRNNMSYQTIADRCHNRIKKPFALDGYNYQFEE